ncbi:MAG: zinc ribbon domain-containing protein [Caldilinea sp. CFX5]|nr:zinc ribbon domain-containing protein [Caldilinea sp. CFX5]
MSEVQRICPQCGEAGPLTARYCLHCGADSQAALPAPQSSFPLALTKAALPILAGAASLALRAAWKLLQSRMTATVTEQAVQSLRAARNAQPPAPITPPERPHRTIRIRSAWSVTDGNGVRRSGVSEHQIEIDE